MIKFIRAKCIPALVLLCACLLIDYVYRAIEQLVILFFTLFLLAAVK